MENALALLIEALEAKLPEDCGSWYAVPALWLSPKPAGRDRILRVAPISFFRDRLVELVHSDAVEMEQRSMGGEWTRKAVVYNMFVRQTAAWDHDGDGTVGLEDLPGGLRETGTFLKAIVLLPWLRKLGVNTIHLLPVTSIGKDGNKGSLGSPYAIRNPYKLDERLAEPFLGMGVELEYKAFVEAAHHLGMRVVMEFVFRTASKDSDWIPDHPNWFYWIDASIPDRDGTDGAAHGYGNPRFTAEELHTIIARVKRNDMGSLPPPPMAYRAMFTEPPLEISRQGDRFLGTTETGQEVRVPGAFADWPPDDVQPPWNDVTYLKLYDHPSFNYIAYNTIRMYDSRLAEMDNENRGLWNTIINIIPHYQKNFGIDGVMIDMGHALPRRLKQSIIDRARRVDQDFAFWEENFAITPKSRQEGYNAAVGYLWSDEHLPWKLREFMSTLASQDVPIPFFSTPESHNTARAAARPGGVRFSRCVAVINAFLPAVWFFHQGYELGETWPVNTGLGFTPEDLASLPSHRLPLFSESALCWDNPEEFSDLISTLVRIRALWESEVTDPRAATFQLLPFSDERILGYTRLAIDRSRQLLILANLDMENEVHARGALPTGAETIEDLVSGKTFFLHEGILDHRFGPGEALVIES